MLFFRQKRKGGNSKYKNIKVKIDGITFDSKIEGKRYSELKLLLRAGKIFDLKIHPRYTLQEKCYRGITCIPKMSYEADFEYYDEEKGDVVVEDVKGIETEGFKIKMKLFLKTYPDLFYRLAKESGDVEFQKGISDKKVTII
jgi:hypothetical protein